MDSVQQSKELQCTKSKIWVFRASNIFSLISLISRSNTNIFANRKSIHIYRPEFCLQLKIKLIPSDFCSYFPNHKLLSNGSFKVVYSFIMPPQQTQSFSHAFTRNSVQTNSPTHTSFFRDALNQPLTTTIVSENDFDPPLF